MLSQSLNRRIARSACLLAAASVANLAMEAHALPINSWIGGDGAWGTPSNWNNGNVPTTSEQATFFSGIGELYASPPTVGALQISKLGNATPGLVQTNGYKLTVVNGISIEGNGAALYAYNAPANSLSVQAGSMSLTNGAILWFQLPGTKIRVSSNASGTPNGALSVDNTSIVYFNGSLDAGSFVENGLFENDGDGDTVNVATNFTLAGTAAHDAVLSVGFGAMTLNAATFNLHNANTQLDLGTAGGTLTLNGDSSAGGSVGSDVVIGDSSQLILTGGSWQFGYYSKSGAQFVANGSTTLNGGTSLAKAARVVGSAAYFTNVNVSGYADLSGAEFDGASNVDLAAGSRLYLHSPYFRGTTFSNAIDVGGTGTVNMTGDTVIGFSSPGVAATVVNIDPGTLFNWDGNSDTTATCTIENGELNINTSVIDEPATVNGIQINRIGYDGVINIVSDAKLNVAGTAWTLFGTLKMSGHANVKGQTMTVDGTYVAAGAHSVELAGSIATFPTIDAPVVFKGGAQVYLQNGSGLIMNGATTYAGCSFYSAPFALPGQPYGIVTQNGVATVTGSSSMTCNTFDMDGSADATPWTINPGVTFSQQAYSLDTPNSTANLFHSVMTLNGGTIDMETNAGRWTLAGGTLNMNGSGLNLPFVTHDKLVLGSGTTAGTVNVGSNTSAYISGGLVIGATSAANGNVVNVGANSNLYVGPFSSDTNSTLTKTGPGTMVVNTSQNHGAGAQINVTGGLLSMNSNAGGSGPTLSINAAGGTVAFSVSQQLATLAVGAGGKAVVAQPANLASHLTISASLAFNGGLIDLNANDMIVHNGSAQALRTALAQGYNGGTWTGTAGLTSTAAIASSKNALGYLLNNNGSGVKLFNTFNGYNASLTDVLVKYTLKGDADLSGNVNFDDLVKLAQNYNTSATTWQSGDFNYDGITDFDDLVPLAQNYNQSVSLLQAAELSNVGGPGFAADFALAQSLVPEPTTVALLGLVLPLAARRRATL